MKDLSMRRSASRFLLLVLLLGWTEAAAHAKPPKLLDIADTTAANPILTQMSAMIQGSELTTFLSSKGPFVLFAPTDAAFAKLPPGTLETLLRPENKVRLQDILLYHVTVGKKLMAKDLLTVDSIASCEGNLLTLKKTKSGTQFVLKAKIVHADVRCLNGVIHEIDTVLMPPESSLPPIASPPLVTPATDVPAAATPPTSPVTPAASTNAAPTEMH